jgi:hypothetical protein
LLDGGGEAPGRILDTRTLSLVGEAPPADAGGPLAQVLPFPDVRGTAAPRRRREAFSLTEFVARGLAILREDVAAVAEAEEAPGGRPSLRLMPGGATA